MSKIAFAALALVTVAWAEAPKSGLKIGEYAVAYDPVHAWGPDKGTHTCPVCKYGMLPAVQVWVNGDDPANIRGIATTLEKLTQQYKAKKLKAFIVYLNPKQESEGTLSNRLAAYGRSWGLKNVALAYLPADQKQAIENYSINTGADVKNTVLVYNKLKITTNIVNLSGDAKSVQLLKTAVTKSLQAAKK